MPQIILEPKEEIYLDGEADYIISNNPIALSNIIENDTNANELFSKWNSKKLSKTLQFVFYKNNISYLLVEEKKILLKNCMVAIKKKAGWYLLNDESFDENLGNGLAIRYHKKQDDEFIVVLQNKMFKIQPEDYIFVYGLTTDNRLYIIYKVPKSIEGINDTFYCLDAHGEEQFDQLAINIAYALNHELFVRLTGQITKNA